MYGNFCGPYWSDGKFQTSVANPTKQPIDDLDSCCQLHDKGYATGKHLNYYDTKLLQCVKKVALDDGLDYKKLYKFIINNTIPAQQMVRGQLKRPTNKQQQQQPRKQQVKKLERAEKKTQQMVKSMEKREHSYAPIATQINSKRMRGKLTIGGFANRKQRRGGKSLSSQTLNVKGADYFDVVNVTTSNSVGDILKTLELHPSGLPNTRLGFFTNMYDQYRLKSMSVEYYSSVGTSTPGQILGFYDPDPDETDVSGATLVHKGFSGKGKAVNVWGNNEGQPIIWSWRPPQSGRDAIRYCSQLGEKRTWSYGKFYLVASSTYNANATLGTLRVRYEIQFITPLLENNAILYSASSYLVTSPSETEPFGTALSGSFKNNIDVQHLSGSAIRIHSYGSFLLQVIVTGTTIADYSASTTSMQPTNIDFLISATKVIYTGIMNIAPDAINTNSYVASVDAASVTSTEIRVVRVFDNTFNKQLTLEEQVEEKVRKYFETHGDNNNYILPKVPKIQPGSRDEKRLTR